MDQKLHQILTDLRRALHEAIAESDDVHEAWCWLRDEGYELSLVLDCQREGDDDAEVSPNRLPMVGREPAFQINGSDVSFLKSIGIDPTRRAHRRRHS